MYNNMLRVATLDMICAKLKKREEEIENESRL